ncbi:MAG: glycoside hydrolase family 15 protein [Silvanigrellaceae bacterium]
MYDLGLIGNCHISALVDVSGAVRWLCFPRPDSPPVFGSILDPDGGCFQISPTAYTSSQQRYRKNTNILVTEFLSDESEVVRVTDFCPRFESNGKSFRPPAMFRIVAPFQGLEPQIVVKCNPVQGWTKTPVAPTVAGDHLRYVFPNGTLYLFTNIPLTNLVEGTPITLRDTAYFALMWDIPLSVEISMVSREYLNATENYWRTWVKHCSIPSLFQEQVIRSALALKLHCFEDTGAILAAVTTSLPEKRGGERNWDYRFCWLRDAFFTLGAFHSLGHFEEMEGFLRFLLEIVNYQGPLAPVYALDHKVPCDERVAEGWKGYQNSSPVRYDNAAAVQVQNDVYGELILALAPIYFDERFHHLRSDQLTRALLWLGQQCADVIGRPDAGIWEVRKVQQEHSFTNLICWAGLDRLLRIIAHGTMRHPGQEAETALQESRIKAELRIRMAVTDGSLRNGPLDPSFDASTLLLPILRFPDDSLCRKTVREVASLLSFDRKSENNHLLYRYLRDDDFGVPGDPFVICSFWLAQAYAREGNHDEGRRILTKMGAVANHLGLFSEHYSAIDKIQLGNFPQAYSHVGMINAAFAVSPNWSEVL